MIRFIDLKKQIQDEEPEFAFYCTVKDVFETFSHCQTWLSIDEFKQDYDGDDLERYLQLIPEDFFKPRKIWGDVIITLLGREIKAIRSIEYNCTINDVNLDDELKKALLNEDYNLCSEIQKKIDNLKSKIK